MRKLKLFFACLLMAVLSIGQVWATDYQLVTSTDDLEANANYVIGSAASGSAVFMSTETNTNNRKQTASITITDGKITATSSVLVLRLGGSTGAWTFLTTNYASTNGYLANADSGTGNNLKVGNTQRPFTISFDGNAAVITATAGNARNVMRYNSGSTCFACYASGSQKAIYLFKEVTSAAELVSITVGGDLTKKSYEEGDALDFSGLTATGNYDDESHADLTSSVEWSATPALTAGLTSVTVTATLNEISGNKEISGLTVVEHVVTPGAYDIPTHNGLWGTTYSGTASGITTLSGSKNDVSITINKNTGSNMYVTDSQTRIYSGYTMVFSVPAGYAITALKFTADGSNWAGDHTANVGTMTDNKNWSGSANSITISVQGTCRMKAVKVTYAVAAPSKTPAGLAYATEDAQKLVKVGGSLVAPTLSNDNGLTIAYASSNTDVVEVNASTGAITAVKAAGKAVITASSEEDETYEAGEASYTIFVATEAGTAEDPLSEASAKALIDLGCGMDVYMVGTVATKTYYGSKTYTLDLAGGMQYYYFYKAAGETVFESDELKVGDIITAYGTLKKVSDKYRLNPSYMVARIEYTEPLVDISNTKGTAYTVAEALELAGNPTSDLTKPVYIKGVVYDVKSFDQTNGTLDIYIKDEGVNNKFEFYKCAGIYDESLTAFTAADDVQVGDEVIGYGVMKYYSGGSIWEFDNTATGDYLVELTRPEVAVESVSLPATASVEIDKTVSLTATVNPDNASDKSITWSVQSGSAYASVADGVVTGIAAGEAVIRAASTVDPTKYADCTVTVTEPAPLSPWATVYTSNVDFVGGGNSHENNSKVVINEVQYDAQKVGASSNTGTVTVTVPAYTHTLHFHVFTWKDRANVLSISGDLTNLSASTINVNGDAAGAASTPYTINSNPVDHYQYITFDPVAAETEITFSWSSGTDKRFVMYGINQEGGVLPVLDHIVITGNASTTEYEAGDVFSLVGLGVDAYYTLGEDPIAEPTHLDVDESWSGWSVSPAILTGETTSVTVTATYEDKQANKDVNVTVNVPATPEILASPASINFGTVNQNAAVDAQGISVTLKAVAAATVTLAGDGATAFSIDKAALTELNSTITVTPVTTATGTFAATVTISDDADAADDVVINLSMKVEAVEDLSGTWVKATSVAAGDRIIIGATYQSATKTIGGQNPNNRAAIASTLSDGVLTPGEGTKTFLVVDAGDGKFALQGLNGKYLTSATSGTSNNLLETENYDLDNAKWTITIEEGVASVVAAAGSRTYMKYNNGSTIFSCYQYSTSQQPINIYKKETVTPPTVYTVTFNSNGGSAVDAADVNEGDAVAKPADPTREGYTFNYWTLNEVEYDFDTPVTDDITLVANWTEDAPTPVYTEVRNGLTEGWYYTMCLNQAVTAVQGGSIWRVLSKAANGTDVILEEVLGTLDAGRPYIFFATANTLQVAYTGDAVLAPVTEGNNGLVGSFTEEPLAQNSNHYIIYNNALYYVNSDNVKVGAHRAYLDMTGVPAYNPGSASSPRRRVTMTVHGEQVATGMDALDASEKPVKMVINGQLFILRGEKLFDATGRLVK